MLRNYNVTGRAATLGANDLRAANAGIAEHAKEMGTQGAGGKARSVFFSNIVSGAPTVTTMANNAAEGAPSQASQYSFAVKGQGGMVVQKPNGDLAVMRSGHSEGLNKNKIYTVGIEGYTAMGWRARASDQALLGPDGLPIAQINDTANLVPIDLSNITYDGDPTTTIYLDNTLNTAQEKGTSSPQLVKFYDQVGGSHRLNMEWTKVYDATDDQDFGAHTGCDVWQLTMTYDDDQPVYQDSAASSTLTFDAANAPFLYFKDGVLVGMSAPDDATQAIETYPQLYIGYENSTVALSPMGIDLSLSTAANGGRSSIKEAAIDQLGLLNQYQYVQDGKPYQESNGWSFNDKGEVYVNFPSGKSVLSYVMPMGYFANVNGVKTDGSLWHPTADSGEIWINLPGVGPAGMFMPEMVEEATTDVLKEMIDVTQLTTLSAAYASLVKEANESEKNAIRALG